MQVTEKSVEGLSRSYGVMVPMSELNALLEARIAEVTPTLNLKGFRPGKVPTGHVRRLYGKALMSEVLEKTLNETSQKVLSDNNLRIASQPEIKPVSDMDAVMAGREDLAYDIDVDVMPDFEPMDTSVIDLTRLVYEPTQEEVSEALAKLAEENRTFESRKGKSTKSRDGDQIVIDFVGRLGDETFEGGTATDVELVIGSGQFIPGFEGQLVGHAAGADVKVTVTFPDDYSAEHLKGQEAVFDVTVKDVRAAKDAKVDDALAERLGMADLPALETAVRSNIEREFAGASRFKLKRALLDVLDNAHVIELPSRMVEAEFAGIWRQVEQDKTAGEISPDDEGKSEETLKAEYHKIAERRVRLGLVLAEIGRRANVTVTEAELGDAMRREAIQYGAQAQQVFEMLRQNPDMQTQMRAPVYEEKVVDLIIASATVTNQAVSKEVLLAEDDVPAAISAPATKPTKVKKKAAAAAEPVIEGEAVVVEAASKPKAKKKPVKAADAG